jgi:hypothetical protein
MIIYPTTKDFDIDKVSKRRRPVCKICKGKYIKTKGTSQRTCIPCGKHEDYKNSK